MSKQHRIQIDPIPAFRDNYIWALRCADAVAVVDPGDAQPVNEYVARERLRLTAILATHHHADHVGGISGLVKAHGDRIPVYGPRDEPITTLTHPVAGGDQVEIPELGVAFRVLDIPGHTRAHIAYYGSNMLFCGDTLFACGCGRVFEGTPAQMHASLGSLAALPDDTLVYCGHEYTLANIQFARSVEPDNIALADRERNETATRAENRPTLPTSVGREKATNPFLRCEQPGVVRAASRHQGSELRDPVAVFAAIRDWKNRF